MRETYQYIQMSKLYLLFTKCESSCVLYPIRQHTYTLGHTHMHKITHQRIYKTRDKFMQVYREMNYIMLDTFMYDLHITCMNIL